MDYLIAFLLVLLVVAVAYQQIQLRRLSGEVATVRQGLESTLDGTRQIVVGQNDLSAHVGLVRGVVEVTRAELRDLRTMVRR